MFSHAYEGSVADALEEHLARFDMHVTARPLPGSRTLSSRGRLAAEPGLRIWCGEHSQGLMMTSDRRPDAVLVYAPLAGDVRVRTGGAEMSAAANDVLVGSAPEFDSIRFAPGTRTHGVSIDRTVLLERLSKLLDAAPTKGLDFQPFSEADPRAADAFRTVLSGAVSMALHGGVKLESPALGGLVAALPDLLLECLPHTYSEALRRPVVRIGPRQVRRAVAYIRDKPMPVLTTDELADICGVSVRSLQYTFREFVGMAPAEYWRKVRLERAVDQARRNPSDSLSRIAAEWGFTNVTRFRSLAAVAGFAGLL